MQMCKQLNQLGPDLICLQEVQSNRYIPALEKVLTETPHFAVKKNKRRPFGGMLTASKYPYLHWEYLPYPNRGRRWSIGHADWALVKGILITRLEVDHLPVVMMNTHLQANYLAGWSADTALTQVQRDQVNFLADTVQEQDANALVMVCGDFNFPPQASLYREFMERSGLTDPLANDPRPTYQPFPLVSSIWSTRLDYALYRAPADLDIQVSIDIARMQTETARLPLNRFLTDHFLLKFEASWNLK